MKLYSIPIGTVLSGFVLLSVIPIPTFEFSQPKTLGESKIFGRVIDESPVVHSAFPIDYFGASWLSGDEPSVRFLENGKWSQWITLHKDDLPLNEEDGRTFSSLIPAHAAKTYQLKGNNTEVRAVVINTTDGPRSIRLKNQEIKTSQLTTQPAIISRAEWGADESYRFNANGTLKVPPTFYPTQKIILHHTAGINDDPDPAKTIRALYYFHVIERGWADIGYNFIIDAQGKIYKGRYSGQTGTWYEDTLTGENELGQGVTGAHAKGGNQGSVGIAVLGTYSSVNISDAARSILVDHIAWESEKHGLDPLEVSYYTNPESGDKKLIGNISGHRDWLSTECPGGIFYNDLEAIRQAVAAKVSIKGYAPISVTITNGSSSDPVSALEKNDGINYRVGAAKIKKYISDWYGQVLTDVISPQKATVTYGGFCSRTVSQLLYLYNFSTSTWEQFASSNVSTTNQIFTWSTNNPIAYISGNGTMQIRVKATSPFSFACSADYMHVKLEY